MARDWRRENQDRLRRGAAAGLSPAAARGHPRGDEPRASDVREAARHPESSPIGVLQRAALAHARATWRDKETYSDERFEKAVRAITDRETLNKLRTITRDEWRQLAAVQEPGNPFFYH